MKYKFSNLWAITAGERWYYVFATVSSTLSYICLIAVPVIGMYALDVVTEQNFGFAHPWIHNVSEFLGGNWPYSSYLIISAILGIAFTFIGSTFQFGRDRLSAVASERIARRLRHVLFDRLHRARISFFDNEEVGDLVQRCTSDVDTVRRFVHADVDAVARALLFLAVMIPVLAWRNITLTGLALILLPLIVFGGIYFFKAISSLFQEMDESEGRLTSVLQENLSGIRVIQAFAQEEHEYKRFTTANRDFRDRVVKLNSYEAVYWGVSDTLCMLQTGVVLIAAGYFVMQGSLSIGEFMMFTMLTGMVTWRIRQLIDVVEHTGKTLVALRRISHILNSEQEPDQQFPHKIPRLGAIKFQNVSLSYDGITNQLSDISLSIEPGETIGIVGRPGSGKSSLVRALLRFYPVNEGTIFVDGINIEAVNTHWVRNQIACVMQEPFLFSRTIEQNLRFGTSEDSSGNIEYASRMADIHDTILEFSAKFATRIGERGINLSGGQRQRMALARAFLKNAPILILDDVLSGVDTQTERAILKNLSSFEPKPTTIIVAHRLTTIRNADRIVVMNEGKIAQLGTHEQLVSEVGLYRDICEIQDLLDEAIAFETQEVVNG